MENILRSGLEELGISAPEAAFARFRTYYERLTEVGSVMNLTAIEGEGPVARLHFLDSAALLNYADFSGARVVDVGTGAGFPGLPLAILRPDADFTLLDSQQKRIDFIAETAALLGLENTHCEAMRAEEVAEAAKAIETLGGSAPEIRTYTIPGTDVVRTAVIIKKTAPTPAKYPRRWARISKQPL